MGDGAQVAARFANGVHIARAQHPDKGVLGKISGIAGVAQAGAQPVLQPTVMFAIKRMQGSVIGSRHERLDQCSN
ncbi:hypothetical protein D3C73_1371770 [compost metagenome]